MNTALTLQIGGDISRLRAELNKANGLMNGFKSHLASVGSAIGVTFGTAMAFQGLKYGINVIGDFTHAMQEVRAITNATDEEFKSLKDNALELGRTTKFTAKEVAELQIAFGRLGFSNREILAATEATLQLASATGEDLAKSADIAGSTLRAFNLDASEMQRVVDVMAASFNKSALGLDNFGEAIKYVAPVAAAANITLEETTAMLGVLADAGIRGSMAGTSLRKIISDVKDESGTLAERLQKLADEGMSGAEAMDEVGRTAYASLLILTKHIAKVGEAETAYKNASGEAQKMSDLMEDDLWGDFKKMTSAVDGLILKFSDGTGPLRELTQGFTDLIKVISDDKVVKFIQGWLSLATIVPRTTFGWIGDALEDEAETFEEMQQRRRKIWEDTEKKRLDDEIKKLAEATEAREKYNQAYRKIFKSAGGFKNPAKPFGPEDVDIDGGSRFTSDEINSGFGIDPSEPVDGVVDEVAYNRELHESLITLEADREKQLEQMQATAEAATSMGQAIGDAFNQMLSGTMNFAQGLAKVTEEIITMYLKQSIAAMITKAIQSGGPFPFVSVALASAGIGMVKALFGQIGGAMGGGSSSGGGQVGRTPSEMNVKVGGRIRGYDLAIVGDKESYRRSVVG